MNARAALQQIDETLARMTGDRAAHIKMQEAVTALAIVVGRDEKRQEDERKAAPNA